MAALLDAPARTDHERRVEQAEEEMDNLRAAFVWSLETGDVGRSLELALTTNRQAVASDKARSSGGQKPDVSK